MQAPRPLPPEEPSARRVKVLRGHTHGEPLLGVAGCAALVLLSHPLSSDSMLCSSLWGGPHGLLDRLTPVLSGNGCRRQKTGAACHPALKGGGGRSSEGLLGGLCAALPLLEAEAHCMVELREGLGRHDDGDAVLARHLQSSRGSLHRGCSRTNICPRLQAGMQKPAMSKLRAQICCKGWSKQPGHDSAVNSAYAAMGMGAERWSSLGRL